MGGLAVRRNFISTDDATVVKRLRGAGAVVLGKTNLSEGAAAGYNPAMDVPLNPWNHDRWPGMSSSGSGVAVAAGLCFAAVGTDTGGSIRNPSSANGVVGLKPTYGRVSRYGVMPMAPSLDHVGAMAREVADAAILFDAMEGRDPADPTCLAVPPAETVKALGAGVRGLRIGLDHAYALERTDPGQARAIEAALMVLERQGAVITPVRMPDVSAVTPNWLTLCSVEMAAAHAATYPSRASGIWTLSSRVPRLGPLRHAQGPRRCAPLSRGPDGQAAGAPRDRGRDGGTGRRRSSLAHHPCAADGRFARIPQGLGRGGSEEFRVHYADGSSRLARDLPSLRLLG